jgi:hypothetical protein
MRTESFTPGVKRPGRKADHSPPSSAEVKNTWSYTSTNTYVFMAWCLVKDRDKFALTFSLVYVLFESESLNLGGQTFLNVDQPVVQSLFCLKL